MAAASLARHHEGFKYGNDLSVPGSGLPAITPGSLEAYFDGHVRGPGIWKWRHYFPVYERHLAKFVGHRPRVVEIGIFSGGSLGMWHAYFGPGTKVFGVDIEPACKAYEDDDTRIFIGDQSDRRFWTEFVAAVPEFDVVIDDGGHAAGQLIPTFELLLPHLAPGGVYVFEDVQGRAHAFHDYAFGLSRNLHGIGPGDADSGITPSAFQQTVDSIHSYPYVWVVERRDTQLETLINPKHGTQWQPFYKERGDVFPEDDDS